MDRVRLGIIGVCGRGALADTWRDNPRAEIVGGADISPDNLADFKRRMGEDVFVTEDYRRLIERPDVDAIAVTSPDFLHEEHAVAALEAGKHVFCEKPLAISIAGCDHILRAHKQSGRRFMMGFNMRYMNMFRVMKDIIDRGTIGEPKAVWCRHFVGMGRTYYFQDWHRTQANANSLLLQKGSHDLDMIHWLSGQYTKKVAAFGSLDLFGGDKPNDLRCPDCDERATCLEASENAQNLCAFAQEIDVEDNQVAIMELEGGIKASYTECHFTPDYHRNFVVIGTEGSVENHEPSMKVWVKMRRTHDWRELSDRTHEVKEAVGSHAGADPIICEDFIEMVLSGKEPLATPVDGRMSVAAGCCMADSLRHGGQVRELPPIQW